MAIVTRKGKGAGRFPRFVCGEVPQGALPCYSSDGKINRFRFPGSICMEIDDALQFGAILKMQAGGLQVSFEAGRFLNLDQPVDG